MTKACRRERIARRPFSVPFTARSASLLSPQKYSVGIRTRVRAAVGPLFQCYTYHGLFGSASQNTYISCLGHDDASSVSFVWANACAVLPRPVYVAVGAPSPPAADGWVPSMSLCPAVAQSCHKLRLRTHGPMVLDHGAISASTQFGAS